MLDALLIALLVLTGAIIAQRSFARPRGVYARSLACALSAPLIGALIWFLAKPGNEAGLGAFFIWCAITGLVIAIALTACLAATARHALDATQTARSTEA